MQQTAKECDTQKGRQRERIATKYRRELQQNIGENCSRETVLVTRQLLIGTVSHQCSIRALAVAQYTLIRLINAIKGNLSIDSTVLP